MANIIVYIARNQFAINGYPYPIIKIKQQIYYCFEIGNLNRKEAYNFYKKVFYSVNINNIKVQYFTWQELGIKIDPNFSAFVNNYFDIKLQCKNQEINHISDIDHELDQIANVNKYYHEYAKKSNNPRRIIEDILLDPDFKPYL